MKKIIKITVVMVCACVFVFFAVQSERSRHNSRGMALLNWFPRVKAKILRLYSPEQLAGSTIRAMERILEESKSNDVLSPRDFLEFKGAYAEDRIEDAAQAQYARLAQSREEQVLKAAIMRQIEEAEQIAYAYIEALAYPAPAEYSFYTGGF